ncbi:MAG: hypothetical protein WBN32_01070 [Woeseia sp.]
MKTRTLLFKVILAIGAITVVSGFVQLVAPNIVLGVVGGESTPTSRHFFAIVGMFMVLFGGMLCHALLSAGAEHVAVLWAGLQKFGAAGAVSVGAVIGIFSWMAMSVAAFDLFSGILIVWYWLSVKPS